MLHLTAIWTIARVEAKLLFRSWAFRIFAIIGLFFIVTLDIVLGTGVARGPHEFRALAGSLPLMNIKLLNMLQGIIAIFLATEFIKRDRQQDTAQVVFVRSFSNADYVIGKLFGVGFVFLALNVLVLALALVIDLFFSSTAFAWTPYLLYPLLISLPTVVFITGLAFVLITVLRSQALVFILLLGYSLVILIPVQLQWFGIFDAYAFHTAMTWSEFTGLPNWREVVLLRGAYLLAGTAFIGITVMTTRRLPQSRAAWTTALVVAVAGVAVAVAAGVGHISGKLADRSYREELRKSSQALAGMDIPDVVHYDLQVQHSGSQLTVHAEMRLTGWNVEADSMALTLNPGLRVTAAALAGEACEYRQDRNVVWCMPSRPLSTADTAVLALDYEGGIDDRCSFLDIGQERLEAPVMFWVFRVDRRASVVTDRFVHLPPECCWYPSPGARQGAAFPQAVEAQYATYAVQVTVPTGLTALSQGAVKVDSGDGQRQYRFVTDERLPQISLTIGEYEQRQMAVDSVTYGLYTRPGHDYFEPYFDSLGDTLSTLISSLRAEYETRLGLKYPHARLSIVEVPVYITSYNRLWTTAHEMVQPELVFLPEMGVASSATDFDRFERMAERNQERMNQEEPVKQSQAQYFSTFVKALLLGLQQDFRRGPDEAIANEAEFTIAPNCVSYVTRVSSEAWPVLGRALESYLRGRAETTEAPPFRFMSGLTDAEEANQTLAKYSLKELMSGREVEAEVLSEALAAKGRFLFKMIEAKIGAVRCNELIDSLLEAHAFRTISGDTLVAVLSRQMEGDLRATIEDWYASPKLPGYIVSGVQCYQVVDGERRKTQVKMVLSNPTTNDGLVELRFRYQQRERGARRRMMMAEGPQADLVQTVSMPATTVREIALILNEPLQELTIETYVSRNIPATLTYRFRELELKKREGAEVYERSYGYLVPDPRTTGQYVIDNEDDGFAVVGQDNEFWLRRVLLSVFGSGANDTSYTAFQPWNPPSNWARTPDQSFYGEFARSGLIKKVGSGKSSVSWTTAIAEPGDYDIYYYWYGELNVPGFWRQEEEDVEVGTKQFRVHHADGVDEFSLELDVASEGWNVLGSYRLAAGEARVELSDNGTGSVISADAVKWVRQR